MITKDEDVNPESSKIIEQQAIMDDTENMQIDEVIIIFSHVIIIVILAGQNNMKKGTSEQMQPTQDNELAQTFDTEGAETIGDKLADSNVRADKDEADKKKSTPSTHSEELTFKETSEQMQKAQDEELAHTRGTEGAETIGDKLAD
ncbi:hypothetical protein D1007_01638 [Hordeum vulgare]|nr:hypothetical protein D1007_01638 [Hordeum vulgare]